LQAGFGQSADEEFGKDNYMSRLMTRMCVVLAALLFSVGLAGAQETKIKVPLNPTAADSGDEMYKEYCVDCHGKTGKGDGPAAAALKTSTPDLTLLAKKNGGKFPADHVRSVLEMGVAETAHGKKDMPIWGPLFKAISRRDSRVVNLRISSLTAYIKAMQTK
jgi:mono/diheme cytochrome c family protein